MCASKRRQKYLCQLRETFLESPLMDDETTRYDQGQTLDPRVETYDLPTFSFGFYKPNALMLVNLARKVRPWHRIAKTQKDIVSKSRKPESNCHHTDLPFYAKGVCRRCY